MNPTRMPTAEPGVYLFRAPTRCSIDINEHIVTLFFSSAEKVCGILIAPETVAKKDLTRLLDSLLRKMTHDKKPESLQLKLFGGKHSTSRAVKTVEDWIAKRRLTLVAKDTGRKVARSLLIECDSGRVGVQYAESHQATFNPPSTLVPKSRQRR